MPTVYRNEEWISTQFVIDGKGDPDYEPKIVQWLTQLYSFDRGERFLKAMDGAGKQISIKAGNSFCCRASGEDQFPKFLQHLRATPTRHSEAAAELEWAIDRSPYKKNPYSLAKQLATTVPVLMTHAFSPKMLRKFKKQKRHLLQGFGGGKARVFKPSLGGYGQQLELVVNKQQADDASREWAWFLVDYLDGKADAEKMMRSDSKIVVALLRCLHQYLKKGDGIPVTVETSDSTDTACAFDKSRKERPMAIAFAHELVHAYYAVTGTRIFPEGTEFDEAVTTGLPPFHFQEYSENVFRANWEKTTGGERVTLRLFYDFDNVFCFNCGKKNRFTRPVKVKGKWKDIPVLNCEKCGEAIPNPSMVKKLPDIDL